MDPRAFYLSALQQPWLTGVVGAVAGGAAAVLALRAGRRDPRGAFLARWTPVFAAEALLDGWLTGNDSPLAAGSAAATAASVVFVVLGDFRLYALLARYTRRSAGASLAEAFAWSFAPSLLIGALKRVAPWTVADLRHLFVVYEVAALALLLAWRALVAPRRLPAPEDRAVRAWLDGLLGFFVAQYALWILADALILRGLGAGWALRVAPNVMYYGLFVAWAWRTAPRELRA